MVDQTPEDLLNDPVALRAKAAKAYMNVGTTAQQGADAMSSKQGGVLAGYDQALQAGQSNIRQQAAQAYATGQASSGRSGHAGYGAALQTGQQSGFAQGQLGAQVAKERGQADFGMTQQIGTAQNEAAQAQSQGFEAIGKMGTSASNQQKKQADYDSQIAAIIKDNKGYFNDDEATMKKQIENLANFETDPQLKEYLTMRAANIASKTEDV